MTMYSIRRKSFALAALFACSIGGGVIAQQARTPQPSPTIKDDATITVPSFDLPFSSFASREAREDLVRRVSMTRPNIANAQQMRQSVNDAMAPVVAGLAARYPYTSVQTKIGDVPVETFVPKAGVALANRSRLLISIHGGGGTHGGGGLFGRLESLAIMGEGQIKITAVDYRLQPEHSVQDGVDDILTVYRDALKTYRPENIGIYGCSAGGRMTGLATTAIIRQKLPLPGAIGILCSSIPGIVGGDSSQLWPRLGSVLRNVPPPAPPPLDPLSPTLDEMRKFPATLFLTGTRAPDMSASAQSNVELRSLRVPSELVLFDGMDHGFFLYGTSFPETQRANALIANFFVERLGKQARRN
jgi:acetyl esterase/lipase